MPAIVNKCYNTLGFPSEYANINLNMTNLTYVKNEDMFSRFDHVSTEYRPVTDGQADEQTSFRSIVRAMHTCRAVNIIPLGPMISSAKSAVLSVV